MDKDTKIVQIISKLGAMINDWEEVVDEDVQEEAEKLIIKTARNLIAVVDEEPIKKKSEVPCNCCEEKSLQEKIIKAVTDSVKKTLPPDVQVTVFTAN